MAFIVVEVHAVLTPLVRYSNSLNSGPNTGMERMSHAKSLLSTSITRCNRRPFPKARWRRLSVTCGESFCVDCKLVSRAVEAV